MSKLIWLGELKVLGAIAPEDESGLAPWALLRNELAAQQFGFRRRTLGFVGNPAFTQTQARELTKQGFSNIFGRQPSLCEAQFMQGVARLESNYGAAWGAAGAGSFNMGAIQAGKPPCGPGTFLYTDSYPTSSGGPNIPYQVCFRSYPSALDGFTDLARVLYKNRPKVLAAASACDLKGVSAAMYDSHYYQAVGATREARIAYHVKALTGAVKAIATALKEPFPSGGAGTTGASQGAGAGAVIGIAALAAGAFYVLTKVVSRAA